ncbi:MAG TPA: LPS export ABC transporter periplasmic protein LptC [Flavisolibacter sp.]|jgi:LPS export ABC transporter protein LptC|nr:LPS export ABC transporter periplasmic protein LptC [Flavisolibacter sp.]
MNKTFFHTFLKQAAFFWGCLFVVGCENSQRSLDEWKEQKEMVEEARDIQTFFSQGGNMRSKLTAPLMLRYAGDTVMVEFPKSLRMIFFDSVGREQSRLDARYGKYMENLNKAYLRDSVVVANVNGDTLWTPDLWWDQNTQRFYTDKKVRIYQKGNRIFGGKGLEARQDLSDIIIKQPTGTMIVPDSLAVQ